MTISSKAISRLPLYRSALHRLKTYSASTVYSCDIADTLGFTAAQVRKDFSVFKFKGKKKVGYKIDLLLENIDALLHKSEAHKAVLCGINQSGSMFLLEQLLAAKQVVIVGAFADPAHATGDDHLLAEGTIPVKPLKKIVRFVADNNIKFGIITTPGYKAQRELDLLIMAGIKGVLNLSGVELKSPKRCIVNSISVVREFEKLIYLVNHGK